MNRTEHLLTCLAEECTEVGKNVAKMLRFGADDMEPGTNVANRERVVEELQDLIAVTRILVREGILPDFLDNNEMVAAKRAKIEKFMLIARGNGVLSDE